MDARITIADNRNEQPWPLVFDAVDALREALAALPVRATVVAGQEDFVLLPCGLDPVLAARIVAIRDEVLAEYGE